MSLVIRRPETSTGGAAPHAGAVGPDAEELDRRVRDAIAGIRQERHFAARDRLGEILLRDGEDPEAVPVSVSACVRAREFLELLPSAFPTPDVSPDPDGEIGLDWIVNRSRMFSVSIGPSTRLGYSGLLDGNSIYGTEAISDRFPTTIADYLRRLHEES